MKTVLKVIALVAAIVFLVVVGPFTLILGLNLLGFELPYNFTTWAGSFLVGIALRPVPRMSERN